MQCQDGGRMKMKRTKNTVVVTEENAGYQGCFMKQVRKSHIAARCFSVGRQRVSDKRIQKKAQNIPTDLLHHF